MDELSHTTEYHGHRYVSMSMFPVTYLLVKALDLVSVDSLVSIDRSPLPLHRAVVVAWGRCCQSLIYYLLGQRIDGKVFGRWSKHIIVGNLGKLDIHVRYVCTTFSFHGMERLSPLLSFCDGNFLITALLERESNDHQQIPQQRTNYAEIWYISCC